MKGTPKNSQRGPSSESLLRQRELCIEEDSKEDNEGPLPMLHIDDDIESELPIRGRPSKKLLLQKQQQRAQYNVKLQPEIKAVAAASISSGSGRSKAKRSLYKKGSNNGANAKSHSESYVMRLFERSLDLSKYKEKTPLYPICRAWMANQPRNPNVAAYNTDGTTPSVKREDDGEEMLAKLLSGELKVIKQMPLPRKTDLTHVPTRLKFGQDDKLKGATANELLAANVKQWKQIRQNWLRHAKKYQRERYEIIDQIMNVACKRE